MDAPVAESRLPVGSSASTTGGPPTTARAIATRWRSPPESWVGRARGRVREPDPRQRRGGRSAPLVAADPGVEQPVGHVVEHGLVLGKEELLEHEADPRRPQCGQLPVGHPGDVQAGDAHRAGGRPVQGAHQVQQRGLARPGRADDGGQLPGAHCQAHLVQCRHRRRPGVHLGHLLKFQYRNRCGPAASSRQPALPRRRSSRRGDHDALAGRQRAGHLHQAGGVVEDWPGPHRHPAPRVRRADDLHLVARGRLGHAAPSPAPPARCSRLRW